MEEKPTYYSIIPASVRYDEELKPNEKLLYSEITALTNKNGECYATNNYFSKLYKVHKNTISVWIQNLKDKHYINISFKYKDNTKEIEKRVIRIDGIPINEKIDTYQLNHVGGINENIEENNTSINNIYNIKENREKKSFKAPTLEEIKNYIEEKELSVDAQKFYDYFNVSNWVDSKGNKVKNWKQKIITWSSFSTNKNTPTKKSESINPSWLHKEIKREKGMTEDEVERIIRELEEQE